MSKHRQLPEIVAEVADGSHVAFGGFAITRCPVVVAHELVRAGARNLVVSQVIGGFDTDLLVGGGCVARVICSGGSLDRFGSLYALNRAVLSGEVQIEEYSSLAITLRYQAAALGLPFIPANSMMKSSLLENLEGCGGAIEITDPFSGETAIALAPLRPDIAFVHVDLADTEGNSIVRGPIWSLRETALAARALVVVAETVVPCGSLDASDVTIPGAFVSAVVELKHAAHPTAVFGSYDFDRVHLEEYARAARTGGQSYSGYLDNYVYGPRTHNEYLERLGVLV